MKTNMKFLLMACCFSMGLAMMAQDAGASDRGAEAKAKAEAKRDEIKAKGEAKKEERKAAIEEKRDEIKDKAEAKKDEIKTAVEEKQAEGKKEERKAAVEAKKEERKAAAEEKKTEAEGKKADAEKNSEAKKAELTEKANATTEKRQDNQDKRIQHGINKGYLTSDEISKLDSQQKAIEDMQQQFSGDGKINRNEAKQLRDALNDASKDIWLEKHDTDGKQMPVYRLGKDVRLNGAFATKLESGDLSKGEANKFLNDFHKAIEIKKKLNGDLSEKERAELEKKYDDLLNNYFETVK